VQAKRYSPQQLLDRYRAIVDGTTKEEFFRSPRHKKTQELWCAAHFALAFNSYIAPCAVLFADGDPQTQADFELECNGVRFPFQITEVGGPGRRRGDEYRNGATPPVRSEDWSQGTEHGPSWVHAAIEKKVLKNYAGADQLNLPCYLNYGAWAQQFNDIRETCAEVGARFASVWLLNGNAMCCIKPLLPGYEGWLTIPETAARLET
jgi:hypothetical protein